MITNFGRIGVLMGGYSSEREISLKSGHAVFTALREAGCQVTALDITVQNEEKIFQFIKKAKIDAAFIALHGRLGEDGTIQAILEKAGIVYPGSGVQASQVAINKSKTQKMLKSKGIAVADYINLTEGAHMDIEAIIQSLSLPVVVKPSCEGSSIGISFVEQKEQLAVALNSAFSYGNEVLVEKYLLGKELTVGILDGKPLPVIEICPKNNFFDFTAKYQPGMTEYRIPAQIFSEETKKIQAVALAAHEAIGCADFSRVDMILEKGGNPFVLEINTIPGFTSMSLLPKAARASGMDFTQLCLKLIQLAYEKKK